MATPLTGSLRTPYRSARAALHWALVRRLRLIPRGANVRLYALPGVARALELRWRWILARRPILSAEAFAAQVQPGEIEELVGCALCGERRVQPLFVPARAGWSYRVVRCPACGFMYRNPGVRPERLGDLYSGGGYARFLTGPYGRRRQAQYRRTMDAFAPLFADGQGRRLLDFGCGTGLFLDIAHERGFEAYGVDLSPDSVEVARSRPSGRRAFVGAPEDVPEIAAGGFDVITLWSVLAHLPRPVDELGRLRALLAPDGVLLILTVNANSLLLKARLERWGGFTRNHLVFFSPTTLPDLLHRAGFAATVIRPMYGDRVESGEAHLRQRQQRRLRATVGRGNQSSMLRAVAFADPEGPRALELSGRG
jgi:SAM-dependent methyltransferase